MRVVLATVVLVFLSSNAALGGIGLGFCTSFEQNSGDWTFDNNLGLEFDVGVDIDRLGLGFLLETAPASEKVFSYRLQASLTRFEAISDANVDLFDATGVSFDHTFAFKLYRSDVARLWLGPRIRLASYFGELAGGTDNDTLLLEFGGGAAIGSNFNLGERAILSVEAGYMSNGYAGLVEDNNLVNETDITGSTDGPYALFSLQFRLGGADASGKDADLDGVADGIDLCDSTRIGAQVDSTGCPMDLDDDDVPDGIDKCPETIVGAEVDSSGCPKDLDDDDVPDGIDKCPETIVGAEVDSTGCPKDEDNDDVPDGLDKCAETIVGAEVDSSGCPRDTDNDGVPDGIDRCPETLGGIDTDSTGCARPLEPITPEQRDPVVLEGVLFGFDNATLNPESAAVLERVARSLADWPELRIEVGGHSDPTGPEAHNVDLSVRRAEAVRDYLINRGVDGNRIEVRGYGTSQPVADNDTRDGRIRNRRVEIRVLEE